MVAAVALEGWRIVVRRDPVEFVVIGPDGEAVAHVRPGPTSTVPVAIGLRATRLHDRYESIVDDGWARSHRIPDHGRAVLEMADATTTTIRNGTLRGPLRRSMDVPLRLRGRRYRYVHTSPSTADVQRDGTTIVEAYAGSARRRPDARRCAVGLGVDLSVRAPLDATDELAVVVFVGLCGGPGRPGAVRRIADGVWDSIRNP